MELQIQTEGPEMQIVLLQPKTLNQKSQEHPGDILLQKMALMILQTKNLAPNPGVPGDTITRKQRLMVTNRVNLQLKTTPISPKNRDERSPRRMVRPLARLDHQDTKAFLLVQHKLQIQVLDRKGRVVEFLKKNKRSEKNKNVFEKFLFFLAV